MAFGDILSEILENRDISQKKFAAELNIAYTTLNGYIKNRRQPDIELIKKIASALNVTTDCLLGYSSSQNALSPKELSLIEKIRSLSEEQRKMIYDLVDITFKQKK